MKRAIWKLSGNRSVEGTDLGLLHFSVLIVLVVPLDGAYAGKVGFAEVLLNSGCGEDGVGNALGDIHQEGGGVIASDVAGTGDKVDSAKVAVLHDLAPMGAILAVTSSGETHAVGVGALFDGPLDGLFDAASIDNSGPLTLGRDSALGIATGAS